MAQKTVTYHTCDGVVGRGTCGKVLSNPTEGLVFYGYVTLTGHVEEEVRNRRPVIGPQPGVRDGSSGVTALCWSCFHRIAKDPMWVQPEAPRRAPERYDEDLYDRPGKGPSGPLPPPELAHTVQTVAALCQPTLKGP